MECTIELWGNQATLREGVWTSDNDELASFLNRVTDLDVEPYTPQPMVNMGKKLAKQFGGKVISEVLFKSRPGVVY